MYQISVIKDGTVTFTDTVDLFEEIRQVLEIGDDQDIIFTNGLFILNASPGEVWTVTHIQQTEKPSPEQITELTGLIGYGIGIQEQPYNSAVIADTIAVLYQMCTPADLELMINGEHPEMAGIEETIQAILSDTYSSNILS